MAGSWTDHLENRVLASIFGGVAYSIPGTWYFGLFTVAPTDPAGGTEVVTAGGTLYARVAKTNNNTNFTISGTNPTTVVNGTSIAFPTAGAPWGTVIAAGIFDAASAGNLVAYADLASQVITTNDLPSWAAGAVVLTLS